MSRWSRDETDIWRDLTIAWKTERYQDRSTIEALQELKRRRRA